MTTTNYSDGMRCVHLLLENKLASVAGAPAQKAEAKLSWSSWFFGSQSFKDPSVATRRSLLNLGSNPTIGIRV